MVQRSEETVIHTIEPVFDANSRVLVLGTMPSPKSREQGFFYAHPQNRFWRVLAAVLTQPVPQDMPEKKAMLLANGIALWDVLHACSIRGAADGSIKEPVPNDLRRIFEHARIHAVFATGAKAHALYEKYLRHQTGIEAVRLPSPSGANCATSFEALVEAYAQIAQAVYRPDAGKA